MSESSFQNYFLSIVPHAYRTALVQGGGFPDVLVIKGGKPDSLVELKLLEIGPSGDKKLFGLFKRSQPAWYMGYLAKGGENLFVVWKLNKTYGITEVTKDFVRELSQLTYKQMCDRHEYLEYDTLKELVDTHF